MKQIILPTTNKTTVEIEEIFSSAEPYPFRNKIIVQIYDKKLASILMPVPTPKCSSGENKNYSLGFVEFGSGFFASGDLFYPCMNTRTDGETPEKALENIKIRIIETIQNSRNNLTEFFVFDSLKEFFVAAVEADWE